MIVVRNRFLPMGGYSAICLCGFLFIRHSTRLTPTLLRHEGIHARQQLECLYLPFFLWYVTEFTLRLLHHRNWFRAYRMLAFEQEAYAHQADRHYLQRRRAFAWLKYITVLTK